MNEKHEQAIEKLIAETDCPKDFRCTELGYKHCCKVKDMGLETYLKCLEQNHSNCKFRLLFGDFNLCKCPLGVYLVKNL